MTLSVHPKTGPCRWQARTFASRGSVLLQAGIFLTALALAMASASTGARAHGERNQEPFLRMRTLQWFDMKWSTSKMKVNDEITITGRVRTFEDWPHNLPTPELAFLSTAGPGSVMAKKESYLNGQPVLQSMSLEQGREYEFKLVLVARTPGRWHIHPTILVNGAGPLAGPGAWVDVSGSESDFVYPIKTIDGQVIPNLATWGVNTVVAWQSLWVVIAVLWLVWWLRRPLWIPRHVALLRGREDLLLTKQDMAAGFALLAGTILLVIVGVTWAQSAYPRIIPLQGGRAKVEPLPEPEKKMAVQVVHATYDVPGRSLKMVLDLKNNTGAPLQIGEFTSANLRFINPDLPVAKAAVPAEYPQELVSERGLAVGDNKPLAPGETRRITVEATDALWEIERLASLITDPDNRFGGLLFFYDPQGTRHISAVYGPIVPRFTRM